MRIDVPVELATCVRKLNGIVGDDIFKGPKDPKNADYWFPEFNVIGELKCLTENLLEKKSYKDRLDKMYKSWIQRGLITPLKPPNTTLNLQDIPEQCAWEYLKPVKRQLEDYLGEANRQIRKTKEFFGAPEAKGIVFFANDGNYIFPPKMMAYLLNKTTKGQFSNINSVIYFSANEPTIVPGRPAPSLFWIDIGFPDRERVELSFRDSMHDTWMNRYADIVKGPAITFSGSAEWIDKMDFASTKNTRIDTDNY